MISYQKNFIFIHIPKTGGTSVQMALERVANGIVLPRTPPAPRGVPQKEPRNPQFPTLHMHSKLAAYRNALAPDVYDKLYKFGCVRDPWERSISYFFSPHLGRTEWDRDAFLEFIETLTPMRSWLRRPGAGSKKWPVRLNNFLFRRPLIGVDFVMRFENLQVDFSEVCRRLNLPDIEFPHANAGPQRDYSKFYDRELIELIGMRFREDAEAFGYEPPRVQ